MVLVGNCFKVLRDEIRREVGHVETAAAMEQSEEEDEESSEEEDEEEPEDGGHSQYLAAWTWCRDEYQKAKGKKGAGKIRNDALSMKKFGGRVPSAPTIIAAARDNLKEPKDFSNPTRRPHMPNELTDKVAEIVAAMRLKKLATFPSVVINIARSYIVNTSAESNFQKRGEGGEGFGPWQEKKLRNWFYNQLLEHEKIKGTGNQRALEATRAKWMTASNLFQTYQIWLQAHIDAGIAKVNDEYDFDPKKAGAMRDAGIEPVKWVISKLKYSASFDECGLDAATGNGNNARKSRGERIVLAGDGDDGETVSSRGGSKVTLVGGSYLDMEPTRPGVIIPTQTLSAASYDDDLPQLYIDGEKRRSHLIHRESGGMTTDLIIEYVEECIAWRWADRGDDEWAVLTTDGVGTHISIEFMNWCYENRIYLCLRCPYASSIQQPEDVILFWRLKNGKEVGFYKAKQHMVSSLYVNSRSTTLTVEQILQCAKPSVEATFTRENIALAWREAGYMPFLIGPYWELKDKESALSASSSSSSSSSPPPPPQPPRAFHLNTEGGDAYDPFEYIDREKSSTHHASSYAFIPGSLSGATARGHAAFIQNIRGVIDLKL